MNRPPPSDAPSPRDPRAVSTPPSDPPPATVAGLHALVDDLCDPAGVPFGPFRFAGACQVLPSRAAVARVLERLQTVLFPGYFGPADVTAQNLRYRLGDELDHVAVALTEQIRRGLCFDCHDATPGGPQVERALEITRAFLARLPEIRRLLATDVQAAYEGDPAAHSPDEALFCYPGIVAITYQRLAHELYLLDVPLLPRMITEVAHGSTGIDIHPGASIGERFFIDHGTGVVIGETCVIGSGVRLYQGVTLGARSFPLDEKGNPIKGIPRHPIVEDDVVVYGGATILGRITIGRGSVIGGNVWLTRTVPPGSKVSQGEARQDFFVAGGGI
jgi:serine O-acetyltransferase